MSSTAAPALPNRVTAAVTSAAARLADSGPDRAGFTDPHAWRDAAVLAALGHAVLARDDALVLELAAGYDALLTWLPRRSADPGGRVGLVSGGNAERRRRGSFATPPHLAAVLARHALPGRPPDAVHGAVVDPACGTGALLVAAFDRLVALGDDPVQALGRLHGVDADPVAVALCRARLVAWARRLDPGIDPDPVTTGLTRRVVTGDALLGPSALVDSPVSGLAEPAGLVWHAAFPQALAVESQPCDPVTGWRGGFAAVVANPPWERLKVFRSEGSDPALAALRTHRLDASRIVREGGRHPLIGSGEVNAYLPFVETCWRLLAEDGHAGLLVPAGIAADRSAAALVGALLEADALASVHLLATDRSVVDGVSSRVTAAVLAVRRGPPRPGSAPVRAADRAGAEVGVGVADPAAPDPDRCWPLTPDLPRLVNPNTATLPLCGSPRDAALLAAAHRRWPVLHYRPREATSAANPWQVRLVTPLHMTRDAVHFRTGPGPGLLPLWEAKHAALLDHRGGGRAGQRYWVPADLVVRRLGSMAERGWLAGYRNVTTVDAPRTLLPCPLPLVGVGNSMPLIDAPRLPLLLAALASLPVDYLIRQKHAGANLNFFKLEQAAVPDPGTYDRPAPWQPEVVLEHWLLCRFAAAVRWEEEMAALAAELAAAGVDVAAESSRRTREQALAELDAAHAVLLGWSRDDLEHVLSTFGALAGRERRAHGRFLTGSRVLAAYDGLAG